MNDLDNNIQPQETAIIDKNTETNKSQAKKSGVVLKSRKRITKKVLFSTILLSAIFLFSGLFSVYAFVYSNPKKVVYDALYGVITADKIQFNTVTNIDLKSDSPSSDMKIKLILDSVSVNSPSQSIDLGVEFTYQNATVKSSANGIMMDNGDLYFKIDNIASYINQMFDNNLPKTIQDGIISLQNKWVKYSVADMRNMSTDAADTYECIISTYKDFNKAGIYEKSIASKIDQNQFLLIDESNVQSKDGNNGYKISVDPKLFIDYLKSLDNVDFASDFKKCYKGEIAETANNVDYDSMELQIGDISKSLSTTVWVSQLSHELRKIDVTYKNKDNSLNAEVVSEIKSKINGDINVSAPVGSMSYSDFQNKVTDIFQELYGDSLN